MRLLLAFVLRMYCFLSKFSNSNPRELSHIDHSQNAATPLFHYGEVKLLRQMNFYKELCWPISSPVDQLSLSVHNVEWEAT